MYCTDVRVLKFGTSERGFRLSHAVTRLKRRELWALCVIICTTKSVARSNFTKSHRYIHFVVLQRFKLIGNYESLDQRTGSRQRFLAGNWVLVRLGVEIAL